MDEEKTGSKLALLVGLPIALAFAFTVGIMTTSASKFHPIRFLLGSLTSFTIFWNPVIWVLTTAALAAALWTTGKIIAPTLERRNTFRTSLLFTFLVNIKLFVFIAVIHLITAIAESLYIGDIGLLVIVPYSLLVMIISFSFITVIIAMTGGLLIVQLTKQKLKIVQKSE